MASIYPIQFAIPDSKVPSFKIEKESFFSDLSPLGRAKKYKFFIEENYYAHYAKSYFAITMKKGGWDCLRHCEIVASGTMPYFIDIEECPKNTLHAWPKDLLIELKNLRGMPSQKEIIKATKKGKLDKFDLSKTNFDKEGYWQIYNEIINIFKQKLTTKGLAQYVLERLDQPKKVLIVYGVYISAIDYQRDTLISALGNCDQIDLTVYPKPFWHYKDCHRQTLNTLYGRGFSCTATLEHDDFYSPRSWSDIESNIDSYDAIIAFTSSNQGFEALPTEVQSTLTQRSDIVWVDGNDIKANHEVPKCARLVFRREMD